MTIEPMKMVTRTIPIALAVTIVQLAFANSGLAAAGFEAGASVTAGDSTATAPPRSAEDFRKDEIVAYYSLDDGICQPLAGALSSMMKRRLASSDILSAAGNRAILRQAKFTSPPPRNDVSNTVNALYSLDLIGDGRSWDVNFRTRQNYMWVNFSDWSVLRPGYSFDPANDSSPLPGDILVQNNGPGGVISPDLLVPLETKRLRYKLSSTGADKSWTEEDLLRSDIGYFTQPLIYRERFVYFLSSAVFEPKGGNVGTFALLRFTGDLKIEAVCLLVRGDALQ